MRIVIALGGNALLERRQTPDAVTQEVNIRRAVDAIAPVAHNNELVITHGNGPQVGLLALESAKDPALTRPYPFDALGAETQGSSATGCAVCRFVELTGKYGSRRSFVRHRGHPGR